ncbi:MAG: hypothetical protein JWO30_4830 [Fibrobacteres bacterium]|nr:hypothetical protein [Fibrobacterota bacterium]
MGARAFFRPLDAAVLLLVACASAWGFMAFRMEEGASVQVFIGNKKYGWYKLDGARHQVTVPTLIGPLVLEIGEGGAKVVSSPCRNKVCVRTGTIRHAHSEIICMPARVLVMMEADKDGDGAGKKEPGAGTDAVTY